MSVQRKHRGTMSRFQTLLRNPGPTVLVVCLIPLVTVAFSGEKWVTDDAYISYRYAYNLVEGRGLVFNTDEYVEGFTNLLWTLIMAVPEALGLPPHLFAALLGLTLGIAAMIGTWHICRQIRISSWAAITALVVLGLYPDFWVSLVNGLEGGLVAFLVVCIVYLVLSGRLAYASFCGGLLFMTRPDSVLVIPICLLYLLVASEDRILPLRRPITPQPVRDILTLLIPWITLLVAITLWRFTYYGSWVPNSVIAKSLATTASWDYFVEIAKNNVKEGVLYGLGFLAAALPLALGSVLAPIVGRRRPAIWLCLAIVAAPTPFVLANAGDWMPNYRLFAVYAPLMAVLLGATLDGIADLPRLPGNFSSRHKVVLATVLLLVPGCIFMLLSHRWNTTPDIKISGGADSCWHILADAAHPVLAPTDKVTPEQLGIFSYKNPNTYIYDGLSGLTDRHVARYGEFYSPTFGKSAFTYTFYEVQPDLILVHSGVNHLRGIAGVSKGTYNDEYSTYSLPPSLMTPSCGGPELVLSIRKDSVARILPAFAELEPQPITVPG